MNVAMKNGLTLGVIFSLNFIFSTSGNILLVLLSYIITGLIIYQTYRYTIHFRDHENGGSIRFAYAFTFVLFLFIFATIISSFVKYFYLKYFKTTYLDEMYNQNLLILEKVFPAVTDDMYQAMEFMTSARGFTMMSAWSNVIMGVILGLIIALIVKRAANPFNDKVDNNE
jgi:ABC-type Fe3+ transport system permease subunit